MRSPGQRLHELIIVKHGTVSAAAEAMEMTYFGLQPYIAGKHPIGVILQERLRKHGYDLEYIMTGRKSEGIKVNTVALMPVPVYRHVRAGKTTVVFAEQLEEPIYIPKSIDESLFGVVVAGNSMSPEVMNGEIIIVSRLHEIKSGDVCLVVFDSDESVLRRVYLHDHHVTLVSTNERDYPSKSYKKKEMRFLYRVMKSIRNW